MMKFTKIIIPALASAMLLTGCDDQIMQWGKPADHADVTSADLPLAVKEVIANYDNIKDYANQYTPNMVIGIGCGADMYVNNENGEGDLVNVNYQMFTPGNAMKSDAMLGNSGTINFATVDKLIAAMPEGMKLYGHNFFWHTQQNQSYLKSLIAPTLVVESEGEIANVLQGDASNFNGGTTGGWGSWGSNKESADVVAGAGKDGSAALVLKNKGDGNAWEAQCAYTFDDALQAGKKYIIQFYAKSTSTAGELQFQYQNGTTYQSQGGYNTFSVGKDWTKCEYEFTPTPEDANRIIFNFGKVGATYYVDNIKFGLAKDQGSTAGAKQTIFRARGKQHRAASKSYYVLKTPAEKQAALEGAMEAWVSGVANHLKEKGVTPYGYDVVNEPIADGSNKFRGLDEGIFGSGDDAAPEETVADGLSLNWGNNHWYWGYYVPDYHVKAFQLARKYLPAETKLFVNDYNLETSPKKLEALVKFVNEIDTKNGSPIVDGIGTQMHVTLSSSDDATKNAENIAALKEKVDAMFQTMAATGKLVRVTELDISLGTGSPSANQYKAQSDCYQMIVESYKANVPAAQQSGITIWSLSDNEAEHEYWLKGQVPNLFDKDYKRKWAYKGFCDGIAGEDLGLKFGGDEYKAYYEKNNVSSSVSK
ncbi:MAG TPA: endo-1,4-beta-xylanase [Prevotella sp.]|nr:endo-1,4-beta-xylanase [Prevotella sp.]